MQLLFCLFSLCLREGNELFYLLIIYFHEIKKFKTDEFNIDSYFFFQDTKVKK